MAQQPQQQRPAHPGRDLMVITKDHEAIKAISHPDIKMMVTTALQGNTYGLTFDILVADLMAVVSANPDQLLPRLTKRSALNLVLVASRLHCSFGDGGVWPIPDKEELRPQESEKHIVRAAGDMTGATIRGQLVFKADEPISVTRNEALEIVEISVNPKAGITAERPLGELLGGFGFAEFPGGTRRIEWFPRSDLDRRRDHSAAFNSQSGSPMWKKDWEQAYLRSIRAAMGRLIAPVRFRSPGMVGGVMLPNDVVIDAQFEEVPARGQITAASVTAELASRGDPLPDHLDPDRAQEAPKRDSGEGAPKTRATGGAEQNAQQAEAPAAPPSDPKPLAPPEVPGDLWSLIEEHTKPLGIMRVIYDAFCAALQNLPADGQALAELYRKQGAEWAREAGDDATLQAMTKLKNLFFDHAKDLGYEQHKARK